MHVRFAIRVLDHLNVKEDLPAPKIIACHVFFIHHHYVQTVIIVAFRVMIHLIFALVQVYQQENNVFIYIVQLVME